jgi:hypothetical protein
MIRQYVLAIKEASMAKKMTARQTYGLAQLRAKGKPKTLEGEVELTRLAIASAKEGADESDAPLASAIVVLLESLGSLNESIAAIAGVKAPVERPALQLVKGGAR